MPTPPLPLLHQLLRVLHIPVFPPTLTSISPSLLLIILESLLGHPIALSKQLRQCETVEAEICVIKCILGVLADDILALDLTLVDPRAVVDGNEREMEVVIMAFAVVAKRKGLTLRLPKPEEVDMDYWNQGEEWKKLQDPIEPDVSVSFSSPVRQARRQALQDDVFTSIPPSPISKKSDMLWSPESEEEDLPSGRSRTRTVLDEMLEEFGT